VRVVAFNGSARKGGNTAIMIQHALSEINRAGIESELVELSGQRIRGCAACYKCANNKDRRCSITDDIVNSCIDKMVAADGILLASPTYFADVTSEIKALIDRAGMVARMNGDALRRKVGAAITVARRGGAIHAFDSLNHFFFISQMIVPGSNYWNMGYGREIGEVHSDTEGLETMRLLGENMAWLLRKLAG
jgi:multimeric flavodoxin WrbA